VNLEELPRTKAWWSSTGALNNEGVAEQDGDHCGVPELPHGPSGRRHRAAPPLPRVRGCGHGAP
jgi:hypothetical protein